MKTNSKLNALTSLQTAETMARKAVTAAEAARKERKATAPAVAKKDRKKKTQQSPTLEKEIRSIFNTMSSEASQTTKAVMAQPAKGAYCKGMIMVYTVDDLMRQKEEETEYNELLKQGADKRDLPKPYKAKPHVTYAFYPSTLDATRLGSVAVYGNDALSMLLMIRKSGSLFGHRVIQAKLEIGIRPFVDVKLG